MIFWTITILVLTFILWKKSQRKFQCFKDSGIAYVSTVPIIGSTWKTFLVQPFPEWMLEYTHKFRKHRFYGLSNFGTMTIMLQDPELIKQISVKDFDNFINHPGTAINEHDVLLINSLSVLRDQRWKDMRSTLSPAFTGSKMRMMFELILECTEDFVAYCNENLDDDNCIELNAKQVFSKVTLDVISSTAFGLKVDSLRDPENPVYKATSSAYDLQTFFGQVKFMTLQIFPALAKKLGFSMTKREFNAFFAKMIKDTFEHRRKTKTFRPDVIQLLIQAQDGSLKDDDEEEETHGLKKIRRRLTDIDLAAQCFIFFFAGSEATSTVFTFIAYELAINKDMQEKLYQEILEMKKMLQDKPMSYEFLQQMSYLDAFTSEVLRMYPAGFITDRLCNRSTEIEDYDGRKFIIPEGAHVWFNIYGLHHSHEYFPNPEKFSPERFLKENRDKINNDAYMPFGVGPRNCIGSRFALMDAKTFIFSLLSQFKIEVCDKTLVPIRFATGFGLVPKTDMIYRFRKR